MFLNQKTEGEFILELQYLRTDNQRLLNLLSKSQDYKFLGQFIEDSGGAHYIPSQKPAADESFNWVPSQIVKTIEIYKKCPDLSDNIINTLLLEINKSFREREKTIVSKIKHEYKIKVGELKRQLLNRQPYDTVKAQRQNTRLKSELKKANDKINVISAKQPEIIPKLQDLEETFKVLSDLRLQNARLLKEMSKMEYCKPIQ